MTPEFDAFLRAALDRIAGTSSWSDALGLAQWVASLLALNEVGIYRLDELETLLSDRLPLRSDGRSAPNATAMRPELHVATFLYAFGGHSSLMRHLIGQSPHGGDVLLTRAADPADVARILDVSTDRVLVCPVRGDVAGHVRDLVGILSRYRRVLLHVHPNDVPVAVATRLLKRRSPDTVVHFVNHADHVFSVAVGAADRVLEISRHGWELRRRRGTVASSTFIGLPIAPPPTRCVRHAPRPDAVLLSGGSAYKFRPVAGMSLPDAFARLLAERTRYRVLVVGPRARDWWWWGLRLRHPRRVRLLPPTPQHAWLEHVRSCTVYVDSHPLPGGTAFPEALIQGGMVAGLRGRAWGYSPADELLSADRDAFVAHCIALAEGDQDALARQEATRQRCIVFHAPEAVRRRLDHALGPDLLAPPPDPGFAPAVPADSPCATPWRVPTRRTCAVSGCDRAWLAREHRRLRGWLDRATWSLYRQAAMSRR